MASINSIQVKEYIQGLTDENQIRVEKIGSGNWYWSFPGDGLRERRARIAGLKREVERVGGVVRDVQGRVGELGARRAEEGMEGEEGVRDGVRGEKGGLEKEVGELKRQWAVLSDGQGKSVRVMKGEMDEAREMAKIWTDEVYVLEGYLRQVAGGDREAVEAVQRECYGDEYVEGEGLRELVE